MPTLAWVHDLDPIAFHVFGLAVRWYGLAYIAGFATAWLVMVRLSRRGLFLLEADRVADLIFFLMVGVLIGGRLGYIVFYQPSLLWSFGSRAPWWGVLAINQGGMASHGGMIGASIACIWFARSVRLPTLHLLDMISLVSPIGLMLGRLANFINGELLGRVVAAPGEPAPWWAVKFPQELLSGHRPALSAAQSAKLMSVLDQTTPGADSYKQAAGSLIRAIEHGSLELRTQLEPLLAARHPSQLYQAATDGPLLAAVVWLIWAKPRKPGVVGAWFLMVYGVLRIVTEIWRLPDDQFKVGRFAGLSRGQWLSAGMIAFGAGALWMILRRSETAALGGWRSRSVEVKTD